MNALAKKGEITTIRIFASVLLISVYVIVGYNILIDDIEIKKLIQQIGRFFLNILLMYFIMKGREWAVIIFTILFSIAGVAALFSVFGEMPLVGKIPFFAMVLVYAIAVYHLNFSRSFKEYFRQASIQR